MNRRLKRSKRENCNVIETCATLKTRKPLSIFLLLRDDNN